MSTFKLFSSNTSLITRVSNNYTDASNIIMIELREHDDFTVPASFLNLPTEIRLTIYEYILQGTEKVCFFSGKTLIWTPTTSQQAGAPHKGPPRILLTCRQVAAEAVPVLYEVRALVLQYPQENRIRLADFDAFHDKHLSTAIPKVENLTVRFQVHVADWADGVPVWLERLCEILESKTRTIARNFVIDIACSCRIWNSLAMDCKGTRFLRLLSRARRLGGVIEVCHEGPGQSLDGCAYSETWKRVFEVPGSGGVVEGDESTNESSPCERNGVQTSSKSSTWQQMLECVSWRDTKKKRLNSKPKSRN